VSWYEAEQYRDIRQMIKPIQFAVGNLEWGHEAFHGPIKGGACDIIQPDVP